MFDCLNEFFKVKRQYEIVKNDKERKKVADGLKDAKELQTSERFFNNYS